MSLPAYPAYKDNGVEWLGPVPAHWRVTPLKYLVGFASGGTPSKDVPEFWNGEIPWVSAKDMKVEYLNDAADHVTEHAVEQGHVRVLPVGSVVVVVRGMILARAFPVAVTRGPLAINQDLKALLCCSDCLSDFLAWYLRGTADESLRRLDEAGHGTKALRMEGWNSLSVTLPPLDEQAVIAAFLDRETGKIDALVAEQEKLIELLMEKRQAVISHAVTKGLDPTVATKDSGIEWLGEVPADWEIKRIKHLVDSIEQGWSPQCEAVPADEEEWGVLKVGCVNGGVFNPNENKKLPDDLEARPDLSLAKGDLLISRANTRDLVGSAAVVSMEYSNLLLCDKLYRLRLRNFYDPTFLAYYLFSDNAREQIELAATGASSSMVNIGQATVLEMPIAVPSHFEQMAIVAHLEQATATLDALVAESERAIDLLKERRSALITAAVTGKVDVRGLVAIETTEAA